MSTRCHLDILADRMSAGYSSEAAKTGRALPDDEDDGPSFDEIVTSFEALETIDELKDANAPKAEREASDKEEALRAKIATLESEIRDRQEQLGAILNAK